MYAALSIGTMPSAVAGATAATGWRRRQRQFGGGRCTVVSRTWASPLVLMDVASSS